MMIRFRNRFELLESLGQLDQDDNTDLWSLHYVCVDPIKKIDQLMDTCNHYPLSTAGHKSPHVLWITNNLKINQSTPF